MELIKRLRERTSAGILECKTALEQAKGDLDQAERILRAKGKQIAIEKAGRSTRQGLVDGYVHQGKIGVLIEVNCETDFVARTDQFKNFVHELCLHIAHSNPRFVRREDVPPEEIVKELEQLHEEIAGVDDESSQPMQQAHMERFYREGVLLDQPYVRDPTKTIQDLLHETVNSTRENIVIHRFVRFVLGEASEAPQAISP